MKKNVLFVWVVFLSLFGIGQSAQASFKAADVPISVNSLTAMLSSKNSEWKIAYQDRNKSYGDGEFDQYSSDLNAPKIIQIWEEKTAVSEGEIRWKYRVDRDGGSVWIQPVSGLATIRIYPVDEDGKIPTIEYEENGEIKTKPVDDLKTIHVDERGVQLVTDAKTFKMFHPVYGSQGDLDTDEQLIFTHGSCFTIRFSIQLGGGLDVGAANPTTLPGGVFKNPEPVACIHGCPKPEGDNPENTNPGNADVNPTSSDGLVGIGTDVPEVGGCTFAPTSLTSGFFAELIAMLCLFVAPLLMRRLVAKRMR